LKFRLNRLDKSLLVWRRISELLNSNGLSRELVLKLLFGFG
jgi:hypothetical protein